jgi:DNA replication protein DnaC
MGYREFIDTILGEELGLREGRRFRSALKLSGLPHHKTLDEFDVTFQPDLDPKRVAELRSLRSSSARSAALILGPPGLAIRTSGACDGSPRPRRPGALRHAG